MRDKLENASMQFDAEAEERVEEEYESQDVGLSVPVDEDGIEIPGPAELCQASDKDGRGRTKKPDNHGKKTSKDEAATKQSES